MKLTNMKLSTNKDTGEVLWDV